MLHLQKYFFSRACDGMINGSAYVIMSLTVQYPTPALPTIQQLYANLLLHYFTLLSFVCYLLITCFHG